MAESKYCISCVIHEVVCLFLRKGTSTCRLYMHLVKVRLRDVLSLDI